MLYIISYKIVQSLKSSMNVNIMLNKYNDYVI